MKRALIVGVGGQDGALLAELLLSRGYEVVGTSRDSELSTFANLRRLGIFDCVTLRSMSLTDFRSVLAVLTEFAPDEIYNLAGQTSVGLSFEQPVETFDSIGVGTLNLLEAMRFARLKTRFYNAASSECFGDRTGKPAADETSAFRPRSPYGVAKSTAFWTVANYREAYGLFACSGLLFNHESPLRPARFVTKKIVAAACRIAAGSDERLELGDLTIVRDWGWAPEYVDAMWRMLGRDTPRDYVIATGRSHSLEQFVARTFAAVGRDWRDHVTSVPAFRRATEIQASHGNAERAERELGWTAAVHFDKLVERLVAAERDAGVSATKAVQVQASRVDLLQA